MNAASYVNDFYEAIKTHNEFFPEEPLDLDSYRKISDEPVTERDVDHVSELANQYIHTVIEICNKTVGKKGYTSTCHFMADIHRRFLIEKGIKPEEISLTVGEVHFQQKPMYDTSKSIIKDVIDDSSLPLKLHCWLTYKNRYIIDPALQFNMVRREILKESDLSGNSLVLALGDGYSSMTCSWANQLRYEPMLIDNEFFFRTQEVPIEYLALTQEFKCLDAKAREYIEGGKRIVSDKMNYLKRVSDSYKRAHAQRNLGRNDPCWCGSGLKFKKCHGKN